MEWIEPGKPSRLFHAVCAYWLTSSAGFNANPHRQHASRMPSEITAIRFRREGLQSALPRYAPAVRIRIGSVSLLTNSPSYEVAETDSRDELPGTQPKLGCSAPPPSPRPLQKSNW